MLSEHTFDTGEVKLNYAEGPDNGPPLIMLHGFTGRWQAFQDIIPHFLPHWHIYAVDHRGHGNSARTLDLYRAINYHSDYMAFLEAKAIEPAVLLGSSAGGSMALYLAASAPDSVRAVIGLDPPVNVELFATEIGTDDYVKEYVTIQQQAGRPVEELLGAVLEGRALELHYLDPAVVQYHVEGCLDEYFADLPAFDLGRITCPLMLVQGNASLGAILTDREVADARRQLSRFVHVYIEDRGHEVGLESDAPWLPAALEFLESV